MYQYKKPEVGDIIHVRITNIKENLGAFVRMPNGYDGLIRLFDFAWFNQTNILKSFAVGDELDVKVIKELPDGKLNLSRKELLPNPRTIEKGVIVTGVVKSVEDYGLIVQLGDFTALALKQEISSFPYNEGDCLTCVVTENTFDEEKHRNRVLVSVLALHNFVAQQHNNGDIVKCLYINRLVINDKVYAVVSFDNLITLSISANKFIEPFKSELNDDTLKPGTELEFSFSYNENKRAIKLDMKPIEKAKIQENINWLCSQLNLGDIVEAEVLDVQDRGARILISNTDVEYFIPREELSPNKVIRASDELFVGEHIHVAYLGENNGKMSFSRRFVVKNKYDDSLYDLDEHKLLSTMGLTTNKFIGKVLEISGNYYLTNLITVGEVDDENNGKLLIDPINGKRIIVIVDNRLRNFFEKDNYYEVEISLARKEYRQSQGTPYMFSVVSNNIKEVANPYKESVSLSFKQHTSPNTNTSVANLLEEVGKNLYSSKKRMFFELLQNADDSASENGVKVKLQMNGQYFVLTHDGYAFNQHDFESITSAAKSTKRANDKKTGYKGIGFKSVFTNSHSVYIKSGGYEFSFDKENPIYKQFDEFYFLVNDIENDCDKQTDFCHKYAKYRREFNGVKDIPWQLLPIWSENLQIEEESSIFNNKENVAIALKMDNDTLSDYSEAIKEVFEEPRFMLFLRNTNRVQLMRGSECLTIQKNVSDDGNKITLVNSFDPKNRTENYTINRFENIAVNDEEFKKASIPIQRKERLNNRGEYENYLVRVNEEGAELGEVSGIPDRIASTKDTVISFAVQLDAGGHIVPLHNDTLSLYAYLPMNEYRFKYPFYINADFIPKSDREGVQSDNPWNHFVFYTIGKSIVSMVASYASKDEPQYLNLLPTKELQSSSQDTASLVDAYNRGYQESLSTINFILNDRDEIVGINDVIYDKSGLAESIGADNFYKLTGTTKRLCCPEIESEILSKPIFQIESYNVECVCSILETNIDCLNNWLISSNDEIRNNFYSWITSNERSLSLIPKIPTLVFGEEWKNTNEVSLSNKMIILTEKISPIRPILNKLGFRISNSLIENHPLCNYIQKQNEKAVFDCIVNSALDGLSFSERLHLFINSAHFDEIGRETLRKWRIFKNQNGDFSALSSMFSWRENCPSWLNTYMLAQTENADALLSYLIPEESIFSSVVECNIDHLLASTDISVIYNLFLNKWRTGFTETLFNKPGITTLSMLSIVEQSGDSTKEAYVKNNKSINLASTSSYSYDSFEYRWLKLATLNANTINHAKSVISIDNKKLSEYTIKDDLTVKTSIGDVKFSLSKLLPSFNTSSVLSKVVNMFSAIPGYDEIFAQNEASTTEVRNLLYNHLRTNTCLINEEQFCFFMAYRKSQNYHFFDPSIKSCIRINDASVFMKVLDKSMEMNFGEVLGGILSNGGIVYPFAKLVDTYINSDLYTLEEERVPSFIVNWANSEEKKQFLIKVGVHDDSSNEIIRRKSFLAKKNENIWALSDTNTIRTFLNWVVRTCALPIQDDAQVSILTQLFTTLRIQGVYNEDDFHDSKEWANNLYLEWKKEKNIKIYIIDGQLPYRGNYSNSYLFKSYAGEYTYFSNSNTIYISSEREPASVLADVYSNRNLRCPFDKEDWNKIFLVSADVIQEKDERIAELERLLEETQRNKNLDSEVDNHGNYTEKDNTDPETRKEINREARFAAYEYLDSLEDYDCSAWNPEETDYIIQNKIKYKGKYITVAVTSSRGRKLYLHPWVFAEIMEDENNLLLNYGYDGKIHSLSFTDVFMDNPNVNLIFDTDVVSPKEIAELANKYRGSQKTCFVIENPKYSQSDAIQSFGLNEKKEGGFVSLDFSDDDIFGF